MFYRRAMGATTLAATMLWSMLGAQAFDESKYPDWSGQWTRPRGLATQWDQAKPAGLGQQAPLIPEYQKRLEDSIADVGECEYFFINSDRPLCPRGDTSGDRTMVLIGDSHAAAVLDRDERVQAVLQLPADHQQRQRLLDWASEYAPTASLARARWYCTRWRLGDRTSASSKCWLASAMDVWI